MNRIVKQYKKSRSFTYNSFEMSARVFEKCGYLMDHIKDNLIQKQYYERHQNTEKLISILTAFMGILDNSSDATKSFSKDLQGFCLLLMNNLTEINQKENPSQCDEIKRLFFEMATIWRSLSYE